jgi:hypothetical protein
MVLMGTVSRLILALARISLLSGDGFGDDLPVPFVSPWCNALKLNALGGWNNARRSNGRRRRLRPPASGRESCWDRMQDWPKRAQAHESLIDQLLQPTTDRLHRAQKSKRQASREVHPGHVCSVFPRADHVGRDWLVSWIGVCDRLLSQRNRTVRDSYLGSRPSEGDPAPFAANNPFANRDGMQRHWRAHMFKSTALGGKAASTPQVVATKTQQVPQRRQDRGLWSSQRSGTHPRKPWMSWNRQKMKPGCSDWMIRST